MRSTPDNDSPETDRRKSSRRRTAVAGPSGPISGNTGRTDRRQQTGRRSTDSAGASSGMRLKAAPKSQPSFAGSKQSPQEIAQSMIDALSDILAHERTERKSQRAS